MTLSTRRASSQLIALAERERAALVSGDNHLLDLRGTIPVYSPREFLELVEAPGG